MTNLVGSTLGPYQIVELIGESEVASVYKAWQPSLQRHLALQVLAPRLANDARFLGHFQREMLAAANLKHVNILTVYDVGAEGDFHYVVMALVEGVSLAERLRAGAPMPPDEVADVISQLASALDYAHQRGFIHRDVRPANALIDPEGRAVLTGLGVAQALSDSGMTGPSSEAGPAFGDPHKPHYVSPEQARGEALDHRSDLYSLGVVCYEMLAGALPFDGDTLDEILYAQANTPPPPHEANPAVPEPVEAVVGKMLAQERAARYNSGGEFAAALAQAVAGVGPEEAGEATLVGSGAWANDTTLIASGSTVDTALMETAVSPVPSRRRRWPLVLGMAAIGLVLVAGVVLGVLSLAGGKETERELEQAQAALAAGDYAGAADQFQRVLDGEPGSVAALEGLLDAAGGLAQAGQYERAITTYRQVLERDADSIAALRGMGEAYEAQEEWEQAAEWYERWTQVAPDDAEARLRLGWSYYYWADYEQAVAQFSRATRLRPDLPKGFEGLGRAYFGGLAYESALDPLKRWRELEPESVAANRWLGNNLYELGLYDEAIPILSKWAELSLDDPMAYNKLGWAYRQIERYKEAADQFQKALDLQADLIGSLWGLGGSLVQLGRSNEAIAIYQQWRQIEPENALPYLFLGRLHFDQGDYAVAIDAFRHSLKLDESDGAYSGLVTVYKQLGRDEEIVQTCLQWAAFSPEKAGVYIELGWAYRRLEHYQDAIGAFQQAIQSSPDSSNAYQGLANSYIDLKEFQKALSAFEAWAELNPDDPAAFRNIGWTHYRLAEYGKAIKAFERSLQLKDHFGTYLGLGRSYQQLDDCTRAIFYYTRVLDLNPGHEAATAGLKSCQQSSP